MVPAEFTSISAPIIEPGTIVLGRSHLLTKPPPKYFVITDDLKTYPFFENNNNKTVKMTQTEKLKFKEYEREKLEESILKL